MDGSFLERELRAMFNAVKWLIIILILIILGLATWVVILLTGGKA